MINKIFLDYDESILHTSFEDPNQSCLHFSLEGGLLDHYTIVRPCAKQLIEFSRNLVGKENVFILTAAQEDYANKINELADFGFSAANIIGRETLEKFWCATAYGGGFTAGHPELAHPNNVLIDNMPPRYNENKIAFIGIAKTWPTNYLQVRDYYGVNFPDDGFEQKVKDFLIERNS